MRGAVTFSIRRTEGCDWLRTIFPSFSPSHASSVPPHTRPWMARKALTTAAAWRRGGTEFVSVCAYVCVSRVLGGPRPRICCGSVQWTGARQDVTFWRKLGRPYRPSGYQSTPFVPPPLPFNWPLQTHSRIKPLVRSFLFISPKLSYQSWSRRLWQSFNEQNPSKIRERSQKRNNI